jgi:hypothetical protein
MHASLAFVNGAGDKRRTPVTKEDPEGLRLLNTLLSTATAESPRPAVDKGKSKDVGYGRQLVPFATYRSSPGDASGYPRENTKPDRLYKTFRRKR